LSDEFDRSSDAKAARQYLKDSGVDYRDRQTDENKGYGNSITVDLMGGVEADALRYTSIRGTVTEGLLMISRINDFHKLYFEPRGHCLFFIYKDRPGILGRIGAALAQAGINIDDVRNPHDTKQDKSIAILKVNCAVPGEVVRSIAESIEAFSSFHIEF